jgi:homoserine dehydrogenase
MSHSFGKPFSKNSLNLLASIAFGIPLQFDKVYCEGITNITLQDVTYAEELGYRIKHLGFAVRRYKEQESPSVNKEVTGIELRVHPTLIPEDKLLANVNGVKNAVLVNSHPLGQTLYYGDGAGAGATASAVMGFLDPFLLYSSLFYDYCYTRWLPFSAHWLHYVAKLDI